MVALSIVALSLMGILASMNQMVDASNTMRERTYADWIGQNKIAELRLANVLPKVGSNSGEVEYASIDWAWRAVISETGVENLFRVDVTVSIAGSDYDIRTVTGFIGEPVRPGQSNRVWNVGPRGPGSTE